MSLIRALYDASPAFLQDGMVSAYGLLLKRLRYGPEFRARSEELRTSQFLGPEEIAALQKRRLAALLEHAAAHVPFYAAHFREKGIAPGDVHPGNLASALPVLEKSAMRRDPQAYLSTAFSRAALSVINTSGTTGTPLKIVAAKAAIRGNYAFFARFLNWAGVDLGDRGATFAGRIIVPPEQDRPPFWRRNRAMDNTLFSSYHLSEKNIPHYLRELERLDPVFIDSYPSAVYVLARFILDKGFYHGIKPKAIVTSSETLQDHQRAAIEQAFGCKVFDQYGSAEMAAFLSQCEHGSYHVHPEYGLIEVLDAQGRPARPGESGEMVCTGFLNHAMPILRYRIGDSVALSGEGCACGRHFPRVAFLAGRTDDILVTPDGRQIGRLDPIFKGLGSIREAQIIQEAPDSVRVKLVKGEGYVDTMGGELVRELGVRLGPLVKISLEPVPSIPRTASGKFRSVVSQVKVRAPDSRPGAAG